MGGGTLPFVFSYEYSDNSGGWVLFASGSDISPTNISPPLMNNQLQVSYDTSTGRFHIINGGGSGGSMLLRCTVSSPGGTTHEIYGTNTDCTFTFLYSHDSPGI